MMQGPPGMGPVMVLNQTTKRQTGRVAQIQNIKAAKAVADIIRTTLGPRSMLKMMIDPMGSIIVTNDGHCILREIDVSHPTAKSMIELSRSTDEEVGDGTTSVIILAAEVLQMAEPFIRNNIHPTMIVQAYSKALQQVIHIMEQSSVHVDVVNDTTFMKQLVQSTLSTKFSSRWNDLMVQMALQAVLIVSKQHHSNGGSNSSNSNESNINDNGDSDTVPKKVKVTPFPLNNRTILSNSNQPMMEIDLKRYAKIEKIPGGEMEDCMVLNGVMFQKDTVHTNMRRHIVNPRILLLDCPLEYKKGETQTNIEVTEENDWNTLLLLEEQQVEQMCMDIIRHKPDIVITEKGISDLAQHYLYKANITAIRRLRKTDNNRVARAVGATIVSRTEEIQESDIGTQCGLFEMKTIGSEPFVYFTECHNPGACTIILRGGSKDVLNEIERNIQDAMQVIRNVVYLPQLVPGGGAIEMAVAVQLRQYGLSTISGIEQLPFIAIADAFEVIPRTLAQNCGVSVIRTITQLRAKHAAYYDNDSTTTTNDSENGNEKETSDTTTATTVTDTKKDCCTYGLNGTTGAIVDMKEYGIWEPLSVKIQTIQSAIDSACMILRIDDIVSSSSKK